MKMIGGLRSRNPAFRGAKGKVRLLVVEAHALVRAGLCALLATVPGAEVVGETGVPQEARTLVRSLRPHVVLLGVEPPVDESSLVSRLARGNARPRVVVLSRHADDDHVARSLHAGASAYLLTSSSVAELEAAIHAVARGEAYLCPQAARAVLAGAARGAAVPRVEPLTPRQREVLRLVAEGLTSRAIGTALGISEKTVETHRAAIMDRLAIRDLAGLVRYAVRSGLVSANERTA